MQVVKEHGGSIRCDSEVGRGTAFTVRLPAAPVEMGTLRVEAASA
jgi:signal transduction histidine kinase